MNYHHLSIEERSCIRKYYVDGLSYREIARLIGRNVSTVSRELRRNCTHMYDIPTYYPHTAQKKYLLRRSYCHRGMYHSQVIVDYINEKLLAAWSPEQIACTPCELPIQIFAPFTYTTLEAQPVLDPVTLKPLLNPDGTVKTVVAPVKRQSFKVAYVFDISQTEGAELPSLGVDELTGTVEGYNAIFNAICEISPVPVLFRDKAEHYSKGYKNKEALQAALARAGEIDVLYERLYEEHILGNLTDDRYRKLSDKYEDEQTELSQRIRHLRKIVAEEQAHEMNAEGFLQLVRKYTDIQELTPEILREFIDKIVVYHREQIGGQTVQKVEIYYKMIGYVELPHMSRAAEQSYLAAFGRKEIGRGA